MSYFELIGYCISSWKHRPRAALARDISRKLFQPFHRLDICSRNTRVPIVSASTRYTKPRIIRHRNEIRLVAPHASHFGFDQPRISTNVVQPKRNVGANVAVAKDRGMKSWPRRNFQISYPRVRGVVAVTCPQYAKTEFPVSETSIPEAVEVQGAGISGSFVLTGTRQDNSVELLTARLQGRDTFQLN